MAEFQGFGYGYGGYDCHGKDGKKKKDGGTIVIKVYCDCKKKKKKKKCHKKHDHYGY